MRTVSYDVRPTRYQALNVHFTSLETVSFIQYHYLKKGGPKNQPNGALDATIGKVNTNLNHNRPRIFGTEIRSNDHHFGFAFIIWCGHAQSTFLINAH